MVLMAWLVNLLTYTCRLFLSQGLLLQRLVFFALNKQNRNQTSDTQEMVLLFIHSCWGTPPAAPGEGSHCHDQWVLGSFISLLILPVGFLPQAFSVLCVSVLCPDDWEWSQPVPAGTCLPG